MRLAAVAIAALVLVVPAAAGPDRSVLAPATVSVLGADGSRVAFLAPGANAGCGAVRVWSPSERAAKPLGRIPCGPRTSTGRGAYGLSYAESAALWVSYTGGNIREHTVWRGGRAIAEVSHDVDSPSPLLVGQGGGGTAVYAIGDRVTVVTRRGRRSWQLSERPRGLAAGAPYSVARLASGPVVLLDSATGVEQARFEYPPGVAVAAKVSGSQVVVLRAGELDNFTFHRDNQRSWPVPSARSYGDDYCGVVRCPLAAVRLADFQGELAVYLLGREIHLLRVTDGTDVLIRHPAVGPVHAQLDAAGLSYSAGKRVFFIPRSEVDRRLR